MTGCGKGIAFFCLLNWSGAVPAYYQADYNSVTLFQLQFHHQETRVTQALGTNRISLSGTGIRYGEQYGTLQTVLILDDISVTYKDSPVAAGMDLHGMRAGMGMEMEIYNHRYLKLLGQISYLYNDAEGGDASQTLRLNWHHTAARLQLNLFPDAPATPYLCGEYVTIEGDESARGSVNYSREFSNTSNSSGCAGLIGQFNDGGYAGFELQRGNSKGGRLFFGRLF